MHGAVWAASRGSAHRKRPRRDAEGLDRKDARDATMSVKTKQAKRKEAPKREEAPPQEATEAISMDEVWIEGGRKLKGSVAVSGSKNATLPILTATLLAPGVYRFDNVPALKDVSTMLELLALFGVKSRREDGGVLVVDSMNAHNAEAPYELVKTMRASIYVLGPLLARYGEARVSLPGGCAWGPRPVDLHIRGMEQLGAEIEIDHGYIVAKSGGLRGNTMAFDVSSVGATGNILMAAVTAAGKTVIENAACEPEIAALGAFLSAMGAQIEGIGSPRVVVNGVSELHPADAEMIADRIEAGTILAAAAITGGDVEATSVDPSHLGAVISKFEAGGASVAVLDRFGRLAAPARPAPLSVTTQAYPRFPTGMQ